MKKSIFISIAIILFILPSLFGQQNKFSIGITGGPNRSFIYGNGYLSSINKTSPTLFSAGLFIQYNLPKIFSFIANISYEAKGQIVTYTAAGYYGSSQSLTFPERFRYNYITVPLLFRATFGKKISFFLNGGGFASYLLSADSKLPASIANVTQNDLTSRYKSIDFGVCFGLGGAIPITEKILLSLEIRNNLGLSNISNQPVYNDGTIKTNSTNLLLSIVYRFGKRMG